METMKRQERESEVVGCWRPGRELIMPSGMSALLKRHTPQSGLYPWHSSMAGALETFGRWFHLVGKQQTLNSDVSVTNHPTCYIIQGKPSTGGPYCVKNPVSCLQITTPPTCARCPVQPMGLIEQQPEILPYPSRSYQSPPSRPYGQATSLNTKGTVLLETSFWR